MYLATDPAIALDMLLLVREQEVKNARIYAREVAERYRLAVGKRDPAGLVEIIDGRQASLDRSRQAQRATRRKLRVFDKPPYAEDPASLNEVEAEGVRRGVVSRAIYDRDAIAQPGRLADLEAGVHFGEQARLLPELPMKLFLFDDDLAILPLQAAPEAIESTVVVHKSALLDAMAALFETLWELAMPLHFFTGPDAQAPDRSSPDEQRILAMLTAGIQDEVIARELGMSERTYQRRVRGMMELLNAQTRFQLARNAVARGWLGDSDIAARGRFANKDASVAWAE